MRRISATLAALLCGALLATFGADKKHLGGPKGGRFLEKTEPKAEFLVEKDHTATIHFYDGAGKPVAVTSQTATLIADAKSGKQTIDFEKKGESLTSKTKLPEGDGYNVVVQYRQAPEAKPQNHRFKLDLHTCAECKRPEYSCVCDE